MTDSHWYNSVWFDSDDGLCFMCLWSWAFEWCVCDRPVQYRSPLPALSSHDCRNKISCWVYFHQNVHQVESISSFYLTFVSIFIMLIEVFSVCLSCLLCWWVPVGRWPLALHASRHWREITQETRAVQNSNTTDRNTAPMLDIKSCTCVTKFWIFPRYLEHFC